MAMDARAFASALSAADDDFLARLFSARRVPATVTWRNMFDAADGLLDPEDISAALRALPASSARTIADAVASGSAISADSAEYLRLRLDGLIDTDGTVYPSVATDVRGRGIPAVPQAPATAEHNSAAAAEHALTTVAAVADLVIASVSQPVARIGTGAIGVSERRRLVETGIIRDPDDTDELIRIASDAGLIVADAREWLVTETAHNWLTLPRDKRWEALAHAHLATVRPGLFIDGILAPATFWLSAFPWDDSWPTGVVRQRRAATMLGLIDERDGLPTPWARAKDPDLAALVAHLPAEVDQVFLQNDLSVIAPGPLAPAADLRLRGMAVRESHAQASTYRFTAESVRSALAHGETEDSLIGFLTELSLTGIPQPLQYLIHEAATRHGSVLVSEDPLSGRTRVATKSEAMRATMLVDQTLRPLGLVSDGDVLTSRVAREAVASALADAHYPVAALSATGTVEPLRLHRMGTSPVVADVDYSELIARLRASDDSDVDSAWMHREIEQAVRARAVLRVTVTLPDGTARTFLLEAAGLGGGRLRGRDQAADVERTLPLTSITDISVVSS